jgi:hypothetical protein
LLKRNPHSPLSEKFPDSPKAIRIMNIPLNQMDQAILNGQVDVAIKQYTPLGETTWNEKGIRAQATTPSSIIYLLGAGDGSAKRPALGRDLLQALWAQNKDTVISPADTFLPFAEIFGLKREEFLSQLPIATAQKIKIAYPENFFSDGFLKQIKIAAASVGSGIEFIALPRVEFFASFTDPKASDRFDYVLSIYAASERYPAVQLRYLTKGLVTPPIDLKKAEAPDSTEVDRTQIFRDYEKWLLESHQATPLFFNVTLFVHQSNLDIGEQSKSDAEIELWRVRERTP